MQESLQATSDGMSQEQAVEQEGDEEGEDEYYWRALDKDNYEPQYLFAEEEEASLDITDY